VTANLDDFTVTGQVGFLDVKLAEQPCAWLASRRAPTRTTTGFPGRHPDRPSYRPGDRGQRRPHHFGRTDRIRRPLRRADRCQPQHRHTGAEVPTSASPRSALSRFHWMGRVPGTSPARTTSRTCLPETGL
jgi:hypothetical protein